MRSRWDFSVFAILAGLVGPPTATAQIASSPDSRSAAWPKSECRPVPIPIRLKHDALATLGTPVVRASYTVPENNADSSPPSPPARGETPGQPEHLLDLPRFVTPLTPSDRIDPCPTAAAGSNRRISLEANWNDGLRFTSDDNHFNLHVGGNAQIDSTWLIGPKGNFAIPGGGMNGVENAAATFIRRARLRVEGGIYDQ